MCSIAASIRWWCSIARAISCAAGARGLFPRAHGLHIDSDDNLYCTDDGDHTVKKCTPDGKVLLTIGIPGPAGARPSAASRSTAAPIRRSHPRARSMCRTAMAMPACTSSRPDGKLIKSWGESGTDPGQFNLVHNVVTDADGWVYVADRENHRVQVFDGNGKYETQWNNLHRPCALCCCGGKKPNFIVGELGPGMTVNLKYKNLGPRLTILNSRGQEDRAARRRGRPWPRHRQIPRAARPRVRLQGRHLRGRSRRHELEDELPGYADAESGPLSAKARAGDLSTPR